LHWKVCAPKDGVSQLFIHLHWKWWHLLHYFWRVIQAQAAYKKIKAKNEHLLETQKVEKKKEKRKKKI
jgi:hypothetical protein